VAPASGRHHDITGPQSLGLASVAALAAREWGTPLQYVDIPPREHCVEMAIAGEDPWWMYAYSTMSHRSGNNAGRRSPMRSIA
jgi:NAD(P)H dehydrogenase (quinone)